MEQSQIGLQRLANQRVTGTTLDTPAAVIHWMGAMQAQDYHQALWAVGARVPGSTVADVETAIANREIIRTWPMRGTIHLISAEDARWMLELCASRVLAADARRMGQLDLTVADFERCADVFRGALRGGNILTRAQMMDTLENAGISTSGQRGYHILWYLAQSAVICMGPMDGKQQTFVLLDEWAPNQRELTREQALTELIRRFFVSHGPATVADFARWSGLTMTDTKNSLKADHTGLMSTEIDGEDYWMAEDALSIDESARVHCLAAFDEFVLGYKDRDAVLDPAHARKICPGNNGVFYPTVVIDGQIVGVWKRKLKRKSVDISISPFWSLGLDESTVFAQAQTYADFVQLPLGKVEIISS